MRRRSSTGNTKRGNWRGRCKSPRPRGQKEGSLWGNPSTLGARFAQKKPGGGGTEGGGPYLLVGGNGDGRPIAPRKCWTQIPRPASSAHGEMRHLLGLPFGPTHMPRKKARFEGFMLLRSRAKPWPDQEAHGGRLVMVSFRKKGFGGHGVGIQKSGARLGLRGLARRASLFPGAGPPGDAGDGLCRWCSPSFPRRNPGEKKNADSSETGGECSSALTGVLDPLASMASGASGFMGLDPDRNTLSSSRQPCSFSLRAADEPKLVFGLGLRRGTPPGKVGSQGSLGACIEKAGRQF